MRDIPGIHTKGVCLTVGCPGSGKSTWTAKHRQKDTLVVELDQFRIAMFGGKQAFFDCPVEERVKRNVLNHAAMEAMRQWTPAKFVVPNTNIHGQWAAPYLRFALQNNLPVHVVLFEAPLDILLRRNDERPEADRVPEDKLIQLYEDFRDPENQWWRMIGPKTKGITLERINVERQEYFGA